MCFASRRAIIASSNLISPAAGSSSSHPWRDGCSIGLLVMRTSATRLLTLQGHSIFTQHTRSAHTAALSVNSVNAHCRFPANARAEAIFNLLIGGRGIVIPSHDMSPVCQCGGVAAASARLPGAGLLDSDLCLSSLQFLLSRSQSRSSGTSGSGGQTADEAPHCTTTTQH